MLNKKGISPLIATVLILGFTVALASVIMTWGTGFVKKMQETTEETAQKQMTCSTDVMLNIRNAQILGNKLRLLIENSGSRNIDKFHVRVYGSGGADITETTTGLDAYGIQSFEVTFDPSKTASIEKIETFPSISFGGETVVCSNSYDTESEVSLGDSLVPGQSFEEDNDGNGRGDPWGAYHEDVTWSLIDDSVHGKKSQRIVGGTAIGGGTYGGIAQGGFNSILQTGHTYRVDLYYKAISGTGSFGLACLQNGYGDCVFGVGLNAPETNKWYSNGATFTVDYPRSTFYIWTHIPSFEFYVDAVQIYEVS